MPNLQKDLKTGIGRIEFDLDADEYRAIGRITVQWAYLEHGIYAVTESIASTAQVELPKEALHTSLKRRLQALRSLIEKHCEDDEKERLLKLISRIANAMQDRHKITHAMWDWDSENPDRINASSFRPTHEFEKVYDARAMDSLADKIGEISFALEYPKGWNEAFRQLLTEHADEDGKVSYVSLSRQVHRKLQREKRSKPDGE